ncbi:MAG: GLUG motif-containing protein, partial [Betaproteobacteria bacterium]
GYFVINALGSSTSTSGSDLQGMRGNLSRRYALGANIDASSTSGWNGGAGFVPVGTSSTPFTGKLEGLGHTITGLTINRQSSDYVGLFGSTSTGSSIANVGLVGGSVRGNSYVGALVGYNISPVSHSYATANVTGALGFAGGLVGANGGTVTHSYATGQVSVPFYAGGLAGLNNGTVTHSYATGRVSGGSYLGGLVGWSMGPVMNSYATGNITGNVTLGGLVGFQTFNALSDSYATGGVTGSSRLGGLVGWSSNTATTISNSYAIGSVTGATETGGLVGFNEGAILTNSFWNTQTSGQSSSAGGTGLSTAQMRDPASFTGWDLSGVWSLQNAARPFLRSFQQPLTATVGNASFTYNATAYAGTPSITYSVAGFTPGGTPVFDYGAEPKNAGTYAINACCLSTQQYAATVTPGTLTINRAPITITGGSSTSTYTAGAQTNTFSASGLLGSDGVASVSGRASGTSAGTYLDALSGATGTGLGNYSITYVNGALTITPAPLTMPQPAPNANDRAQIDIRRLTSVPDAVRLEVTPSFVFRLVLPLVPPREQPLSTLPQTHPGF